MTCWAKCSAQSVGVADEVAGKTQASVGRTKRVVGEAIEHVGNVIKK